MKENLRQFKLSTGEEIICEVIQWDDVETTAILIKGAMRLVESVSIKSGYRFFSFKPWLSFSDDPKILQTLNSEHVMGETMPTKELNDMYENCLKKLNKFIETKKPDKHIDLDHLTDLTDEEVHEYLDEHMDKIERSNDSDEPSNIVQFPKIFH